MQQSKLEVAVEKFPNLKLDTFLAMPITEQEQVLDKALHDLRYWQSDDVRFDKGAIVVALQSIALSQDAAPQIIGKCLDVLQFERNPF